MEQMPCNAAFKREFLLKCYDALQEAGFTRFRKEGVDWPLHDGFHVWVGLNSAVEKAFVEINPFVGVHVVPIDKLWTGLDTGKYRVKYCRQVSTYGRHMGLLAPKERVFRITRQMDLDAEAARLARLYVEVGVPFAQSIASYDRLLPLLQERLPRLGAYPERVAACLYLMGRKDEARRFTEEFLQKKRDYFEGFAESFLRFLDESTP